MVIALVVVVIFFAIATKGGSLLPGSINNLISQNGYVFVLAAGMLLCILTGGNIDLSVGSVVCFAGTVGAVMMHKELNMWLAVLVMLLVGLAIGAWQAFWIAYVKVPPFITTLAGMLIFRGLSNVVLQGKTVSVTNAKFVQIFGGGANCYVPDFFHGNGINLFCLFVGVLACALFLFFTVRNYSARKKAGLEAEALYKVAIRAVIIVDVDPARRFAWRVMALWMCCRRVMLPMVVTPNPSDDGTMSAAVSMKVA
jgi:putative multiple sugar transport system permease protein